LEFIYIVLLNFQSTKFVKLAFFSKILRENVGIRYNLALYYNLLRRRIPLYRYMSCFNHRKLIHYPLIGSTKDARIYRPMSFNPSRLVFSCCSACFFFVQRFSIYQVLLLRTCLWRVRCDVPHERAEPRRSAPCTYVHESGTVEGSAWHILQP